MPSSRNCIIGSVIATVIIIAGGIGIYFATAGENSNDSPTDELLIKSNDGTVKLYDSKSKAFTQTLVEEKLFGITSFGPYIDQTIYYATTEPNSVIHSTKKKEFPDLPQFTAEWIKSAIAVDDVTQNIYVVDRIEGQIKVVQGNYHYTLPLILNEPKDVILAAESGKLFVLEGSKIIMANMDGTDQAVIVKADNLQAMTVDTSNGMLYFAHQNGIHSYDYSKSKKQAVVNSMGTKIISLAYKNNVLHFIDKKGKSSKSPGTSLGYCRLDESKCIGQCCNVFLVHASEKLEQVKIYKSDKPKTKNPCETKNGGCEQLCLLNSNKEGQSCACDKGWPLNPDKKTCVKTT